MTYEPVREFKLSITRALASQLEEQLAELCPALLSEQAISQIEPRPGIYELFIDGKRVYVGKASRSLPTRLRKHLAKLSGRTRVPMERVTFVCLYVDEDLEAAAPEKMLINKYRPLNGAPWNTNGFGRNDPGRRRDAGEVPQNHFDALYPIDLDAPLDLAPGHWQTGKLLHAIKQGLPYNFRYERGSAASQRDYRAPIEVPHEPDLSLRFLASKIIDALPPGWQLTALPGYAILYRELIDYETATVWWRRTEDDMATATPGPGRMAPPIDDPEPQSSFDDVIDEDES